MVKISKNVQFILFEANKNLLPNLYYVKKNIRKIQNFINPVAIGDKKKKVPFYLHQDPSQTVY